MLNVPWTKVIDQLFQTLLTTPYTLIRDNIAQDLVVIGSETVKVRLLQILPNEQIDRFVRGSIAFALGELGERSIVPELVSMLSNEQIDWLVRERITSAREKLEQDDQLLHSLVTLLATSDIRDRIRHVLWSMSRRSGVRILLSDDIEKGQFKVVKW